MKNGFIRVKSDHLQRRQGTIRCRTVPDRASADVIMYRCRPAPLRYLTTQEKILKIRPLSARSLNSPVICKSLNSYGVSFICEHSTFEIMYCYGVLSRKLGECVVYALFYHHRLCRNKNHMTTTLFLSFNGSQYARPNKDCMQYASSK